MARGKYLSLKEARNSGQIARFCKEHLSEGNEDRWDELFQAMAIGEQPKSSEEEEQT